jgi:hypothetical protein
MYRMTRFSEQNVCHYFLVQNSNRWYRPVSITFINNVLYVSNGTTLNVLQPLVLQPWTHQL